MEDSILQIKNLTTTFQTDTGVIKAVDDLSFTLHKGEVLGLVGESGCGKSVTSLSIMGLIPSPPGSIESGEILFKGKDLRSMPESELRKIRGQEISMIFQEPMTALNPVFTIGNQILEVIKLHKNISRRDAIQRVFEMLETVSIPDPVKRYHEYPHQLSGGMRQRVMIAMALACNPELLIADEPTTALDVTIQAQIIELLLKLRDELGLSILLITHDLGVIAETTDRVAVMYAGRLVEITSVTELYTQPLHPYTMGLLKSVPRISLDDMSMGRQRLQTINGVVPALNNLPKGCAFAPRCPHVTEICRDESHMKLIEPKPGHKVRCVLHLEKT
ncbi:ABC transporter ATP-binding protein [bacterium]|nr:ABC transporter ATP-binding protein [bacterium]